MMEMHRIVTSQPAWQNWQRRYDANMATRPSAELAEADPEEAQEREFARLCENRRLMDQKPDVLRSVYAEVERDAPRAEADLLRRARVAVETLDTVAAELDSLVSTVGVVRRTVGDRTVSYPGTIDSKVVLMLLAKGLSALNPPAHATDSAVVTGMR